MLSAPGSEASLAPGAGGRIAALRVDGLDLLVTEGFGPFAWGAFAMVPWAGRLRDGILAFEGATHELPRTMPPHAIHGTLLETPWDVVEAGPTYALLAAPLGPPWPFGGRAVHRVALGPDELVATLEVHAADLRFPAIVGWHPWFPRRLARGGAAILDLRAGSMLARGDDYLPSGDRVVPPPGPWDDCFVDVAVPPIITWPGAIRLTISSDADHWVVYTMPDHALCVEPQTGPPNGLNTGPCAIVEPGRPLVATMTIRWERLRPAG